ncbi:MAG: hypothetical protein V3V14_09105 [Saprospiraceae bacterium]
MKIRIKPFQNYIVAFVIICSIVITIFSSFEIQSEGNYQDETPQSLIDKELDKRLTKYRNRLLDKCKKEAIEEAILYTDSIVAEMMNLHANDTLYFPKKPNRPLAPQLIQLNDSTSIQPIIK